MNQSKQSMCQIFSTDRSTHILPGGLACLHLDTCLYDDIILGTLGPAAKIMV